MLYEEKAPYLLTILFAAMAWTISQVATDISKRPIIEYRKQIETTTNQFRYIFTLTNISSEKVFSKLLIKLRLEKNSSGQFIGQPEIIALPPTELKGPEGLGAIQPKLIDGKCTEYEIPQLQPGAVVQLVMNTDHRVGMNIYIWSDEAVNMVESSVQTYVAKNRLLLMIWLIALWSVLIVLYLILLNKAKSKKKGDIL